MRTDFRARRVFGKARAAQENWADIALTLAEKLPLDRESELVEGTDLTVDELRTWAVGWDIGDQQVTLALYDGAGVACGLLFCRPDGPVSIEGRPGVVLPPDWIGRSARALAGVEISVAIDIFDALSHYAAGVPATACCGVAVEFLRRQRPRSVSIVEPRIGAAGRDLQALAAVLRASCGPFADVHSNNECRAVFRRGPITLQLRASSLVRARRRGKWILSK